MAELKEVLAKVIDGSMTAEQAAPEVQKIVSATSKPLASGYMEREERALEDKDDTNTFVEVIAAYMAGKIDEAQYKTLLNVVTGKQA